MEHFFPDVSSRACTVYKNLSLSFSLLYSSETGVETFMVWCVFIGKRAWLVFTYQVASYFDKFILVNVIWDKEIGFI